MTISSVNSSSISVAPFPQTKHHGKKEAFDDVLAATLVPENDTQTEKAGTCSKSAKKDASAEITVSTTTTVTATVDTTAETATTTPTNPTMTITDRLQDLMNQFFSNTGIFDMTKSPPGLMDRIQMLMTNLHQIFNNQPLLAYAPPSPPVVPLYVQPSDTVTPVATTASIGTTASGTDTPTAVVTASTPVASVVSSSPEVIPLYTQPSTEIKPTKEIVATAGKEVSAETITPTLEPKIMSKADLEMELLKNSLLFG